MNTLSCFQGYHVKAGIRSQMAGTEKDTADNTEFLWGRRPGGPRDRREHVTFSFPFAHFAGPDRSETSVGSRAEQTSVFHMRITSVRLPGEQMEITAHTLCIPLYDTMYHRLRKRRRGRARCPSAHFLATPDGAFRDRQSAICSAAGA